MYTVKISDCHNWVRENLENSGNGKITMAKFADGTVELPLPEGNALEVTLRQTDSGETFVLQAVVVTPENQIIDDVYPMDIKLIV